MATPPPPAAQAPVEKPASKSSLRFWGILVFVFFVLASAVGGSLAAESSYLSVTLASHIGLAIVTLGLAGYATSFVGRSYKALPRGFAGLSALSALGATIAGTIFLVGGSSNGALYAMEAFAGLGLLASLLMIVLGGEGGRRVPAPPA
jgi:cation transport ATPase